MNFIYVFEKLKHNEPFYNIRFESIIKIPEKELLEFNKNHNRLRLINLSDIKVTLINYILRNNENEQISFFSNDKIGIGLSGPTSNSNHLRIAFNTLNNNNHKYISLRGIVELEIEISTKYEKIEISNKEIGSILNIGDQKVKILEFDGNAFHYKILDQEKPNFKILIDNYGGYGSVVLSEEIYNKFRENPRLDYNEFLKKIRKYEFDENYINDIYVYKSNKPKIEKIIFYYSKDSNKVSKILKIPVNIKIK
ncbi:MAG: hypothetical protein ACTSUT_15970 [Promethearchaeota archaeon]